MIGGDFVQRGGVMFSDVTIQGALSLRGLCDPLARVCAPDIAIACREVDTAADVFRR